MSEDENDKIELAARKIESLLDTGVAVDFPHGVLLSADQVDKLIDKLTNMGFQNAIDILEAQAESAKQKGTVGGNGLTMSSIYRAGASFLKGIKG